MPRRTPFDKSPNPKDRIDLPLFSIIQNDSGISGAYELEGNYFKRTVHYLGGFFDYLKRSQALPEAAVSLQKSMYKLVEIETEIERIRSMSVEHAKKELEQLSKNLSQEILTKLKINEDLLLPGGWLSSGGSHSMVYQFKFTSEGIVFYIHNSGSGIRFHERKSTPDRELYYPVQAYQIPFPIDEPTLANFLHDLILPQMPGLRKKNEQDFDAKKL